MTRSHFGELLIVGANTGRKVWPGVLFRDEWIFHQFPQMNTVRGWHTRFDNGEHEQSNPSLIVALYYRGVQRSRDECEHSFYDIEGSYALILIRQRVSGGVGRRFFFTKAPTPSHNSQILDDGLEAMHTVLTTVLTSDLPKAGLETLYIDADVEKKLSWGVQHVEESFGQGKIPTAVIPD